MFYKKLKKIITFIRFLLESSKNKTKKLQKITKHKVKLLLNKLPLKYTLAKYATKSSVKFGVADCKKPIFFAYIANGDIYFISQRENVEFNEVAIDEVIKMGFKNNEFVFYPVREDSAFFKCDFEVDTFHFVKLIESSNLNAVAHEIWRVMEVFKRKIIEYEIIYHTRLENAICSIDFVDKHGILGVSTNLKWEVENAIKAQIIAIAKENVVDLDENLFCALFENGIDDMKNISESAITQDKLLHYCNRSNLANNIENEISIVLNNARFFISYFIDSISLKASKSGKIFAIAKVSLNSLSMQGSPKFYYANNDFRIVFENENIYIYNLQKIQFILHSIKSKWIVENGESIFESSKNLTIKDKKLIKNDIFLKNLQLNLNGKILHKLGLTYSINSDEKRFVGSGSVKIIDMF